MISYLFWVWEKYCQLKKKSKEEARNILHVQIMCCRKGAESKATQVALQQENSVRTPSTWQSSNGFIAGGFGPFAVLSFSQDIWLLWKRLVEIPSGYHGGECLEVQGIRRKWKQSLKVSLLREGGKRRGEGLITVGRCHLRGAQDMGLALKYSMHGPRRWMGGAMWMVYSLPHPMTTRAERTCMEDDACFAQVIFSLPDSATCTFRFLARRHGWCQWRQRPTVDWRGLQGVTFFQNWASWQTVISKSCCHLP